MTTAHDGGWLDEEKFSAPSRRDTLEPDPEDPVTVPELHPSRLPLEDHQLLPAGDVLKCEILPTRQRRHEAPHRDM